ncbi:TPA: hypothetical protein DEQ22_00785 [Candidatus Nomurabacteria bacterium]|uniref:Uncharacterized protein n=1 Tax=Candidatus Nomurabacteria bacterium RIFOXYA2_FULL_42_12 TaxID=1801801 RepID=A0A1F6YQ83_9BACT|nr:MAG: hypothetical protein A2183_00365 [Candidatus Nomurabacteria bacterium RIFOXYA1_FULL_42_12]OGJ08514.1 MAG: hypothetical protein A2225_02030 [Candidatus Nomurabacteria bacterium RIFOXYA2_FULL_42_12]OGJ10066.1 MAG: hypothetical protein A2443_02445 [Candidatus Nomurabacteria bacterium RIFOXYC2_FULL_43_16]OGJ13437.1 MAG: hypothetical protein A2432_00745 [Candidatus Nomurabacteria bacterium RIFOXYC1_FULL_43_8]OGJ13740.1 MAG: hypothetical protein A2587_02525 [Candidatus Nomurabacteria bacteriu
MNKNTYFAIVSTVFVIVAGLHFLRIVFSWPARVGTWDVPMWLSWLAVLFAAFLVYHSLRLKKIQ